ncbi:hypothetical protein BCR34DRAFT_668042 [Clohesyomyces aquaticus]|uniref:Uncharacterized protein n=1 Tax=Clohesyomyces aquaticus TaxID=1231657 RepID=A0A1Y1YSW7_9PLEO|nr:hypothetical protein BCR34DRAFT_668042 [Clohesyomyces aquaticus]
MSGDRAHWHLVKAIKKLDPGYAAVISTQVTSAQLPASLPSAQLPASLPSAQLPASLPSIEDTLSAFAQHYRRTYTNKSTIPSSAYAATLQGDESPYQRRKQSRCPCGDFHIWGACPELVEAIRPRGFTPDLRKQENIRAFYKDPKRNKIIAKV